MTVDLNSTSIYYFLFNFLFLRHKGRVRLRGKVLHFKNVCLAVVISYTFFVETLLPQLGVQKM